MNIWKKLLSLVLVLAILLSIFTVMSAGATAFTVEEASSDITLEEGLTVNVEGGIITVSGLVDEKYLNEEIYISLIKPESRITEIYQDPMNSLAYFNSVIPDKTGYIEIEFSVKEPMDSYYHLYVRGNDLHSEEPLLEVTINPVRNIVSGTAGIREDSVPLKETTVEGRFKERLAENQNMLPKIPLTNISDEYIKIYVDTNVQHSGNGTIESPFKTIEEALTKIESEAFAKAIILRGGVYNIDKEILIKKEHSGKKTAPLFITAYESEEVILTDGINIPKTSAVKVTDEAVLSRLDEKIRGYVYEVDMNALGIGTENYNISLSRNPRLNINDYEMRLARYPEDTTLEATVTDAGYPYDNEAEYEEQAYIADLDDGFALEDDDVTPLSWEYTNDIWMHGYFAHEWMRSSYRVSEAFSENGNGISIKADNVPTFYGNSYYARTGNFYYFNVLEELNSPGEWVCDKKNEKIYFYPPTDGDLNDITLINGKKVTEKVHWGRETDGNILKITNASNIVIDNIKFEDSANTSIYVKTAKNIKVQRCTFENVANGCDMTGNISECGVVFSEFYDTDNIGVRLDEKTYEGMGFPEYQHNYLQNCVFVGSTVKLYGVGNLMSHNTVSGTKETALNVIGQENVIEYNEFSGAPYAVNDAGAIYISGYVTSRGNIVRYNYVHDFLGIGVYFDDRSSDNYAYGNILNSKDKAMLHIHSGNENVFANNVVLNGYLNESMNYYANPGWPEKAMKAVGEYVKNSGNYDSKYDILYTDTWQGRYPGIIAYLDRMDTAYQDYVSGGTSYKEACKPYNNVFYNNALINSELRLGDGRVDEENTVHDNSEIDISSSEALTNVKSENFSFIQSAIPGFEAIDFSAIGADNLTASEDSGIVMPFENAVIPSTESVFIFNKTNRANKYYVEISKTADFSDEIKVFSTTENWCVVSGLDTNTEYFWRVKAVFDELDYIVSPTAAFKTARKLLTITFENEAFQTVGENTEYSLTIKSDEATDEPMVLIAAAFDEEGRFLGCDIKEYDEILTENAVSGVVANSKNAKNVKFFVWGDLDNITPLK